MKYFILLVLILFISSCEFYSHSNWNTKTIRLGDTTNYVGQLQLKLPKEYDTSIAWINTSDDHCDFQQMTRFQAKDFPKEYDTLKMPYSTFMEISRYEISDSLFGLTISNTYCHAGSPVNDFNAKAWIQMLKAKQMAGNPFDSSHIKSMKYDSIKIDGLKFVIHEDISNRNDARDSLTNRANYTFNAVTSFNGVNIHFNFENSTTHFKKKDYFKTCLEILKTVRFSK